MITIPDRSVIDLCVAWNAVRCLPIIILASVICGHFNTANIPPSMRVVSTWLISTSDHMWWEPSSKYYTWIVFYQDLLNTHNVLACPLYFAPDSSRWLWSADWSPRALPSRHNPGRRPQGPLVRAAVSVSDRQNYWEYSQLLPRPTSMLPTFVITAVMKHPQLHQQL